MTVPVYTVTRELTGWRKTHDVARFYWWWYVNRLYLRLWRRISIEGEENVPREGAAILASNHVSFLDGNVLSAVSPRKVSFMIAREYYEQREFGWMCRFLGCIPVNRTGQDLAAVKGALKQLAQGRLLGCFPEGGISKSGELREARLGLALLALRAAVPVIPVRISGCKFCDSMWQTFLKPRKVSVRIGEPLRFPDLDPKDREALATVTERISRAIHDLGESPSNGTTA